MGIDPDSCKRGDWTVLMCASFKGLTDSISLLVEYGAKVELKNKDGWTAFHLCCAEGHDQTAKWFLDHFDCVWDTQSNNGTSPLHSGVIWVDKKQKQNTKKKIKQKAKNKKTKTKHKTKTKYQKTKKPKNKTGQDR